LDGVVARRLRVVTDLGAAVDTAADRLVEAVLFSALLQQGSIPAWLVLGYIIRVICVDYVRLKAYLAMGRLADWSEWVGWPREILFSVLGRGGYAGMKLVLFAVGGLGLSFVNVAGLLVLAAASARGVAVVVGLRSWIARGSDMDGRFEVRSAVSVLMGLTVDAIAIMTWSVRLLLTHVG